MTSCRRLPHIYPEGKWLFVTCSANRMLGRTAEPFWQAESYDHWVRDDKEYRRMTAYIENNPVTAGLVARAEDYPWSSASQEHLDTSVETAAMSGRATKTSA